MPEIRPFLRHDREQLTDLVNAHVKAVIPGCSVPVATLLSQMVRDPGEYIVDPWVIERVTWVAIEDDRLVAAVHLHRYGGEAGVGPALRDAAGINWLVCWPSNLDAGSDLMRQAVQRLDRWKPRVTVLDMSLPAPLVYGIHDAWPHLAVLAREAGFSDADGRTELQFVLALDEIDLPGDPPITGVSLRRRLHVFGAAFTAMMNGREIALLEVDDDFTRHGSMLRNDGWADISNLCVEPAHRGVGLASWLLRHAAMWLRMGGSRNLISYLGDDELDSPLHTWNLANGFTELNRTRRGLDPRAVTWMTPSEIVAHGFAASPVVMMNEAHNGMARCVRTRRIGREILPAAHAAGCRHLAMEALPNLGEGPTLGVTTLPDGGYLAQPEMRELVDAARALGWTLVAYEIGCHDDALTMEATNRRELVQAENLVSAWVQIEAPMLVWCGNSHHAKRPAMEWTPMGVRFGELAGVAHFAIDQSLTIAFTPGQRPCIQLTDEWRIVLHARGGTAGFVTGGSPQGLHMWLEPFDALILSTDNEMIL